MDRYEHAPKKTYCFPDLKSTDDKAIQDTYIVFLVGCYLRQNCVGPPAMSSGFNWWIILYSGYCFRCMALLWWGLVQLHRSSSPERRDRFIPYRNGKLTHWFLGSRRGEHEWCSTGVVMLVSLQLNWAYQPPINNHNMCHFLGWGTCLIILCHSHSHILARGLMYLKLRFLRWTMRPWDDFGILAPMFFNWQIDQTIELHQMKGGGNAFWFTIMVEHPYHNNSPYLNSLMRKFTLP